MARLPFDQIDVLIVGELGKNYSGTGLDPNVIGRQRVETMPDLPTPVITRLAVLDLSVETRGNALGIGLADLTTERLVRRIDPEPMRVNSLTSNFLTRARVPLALPTDRDVIAASLDTCWRIDRAQARMVLIPNTLELTTLWVTPALESEVDAHPELSLRDRFPPHSVRSRRKPRAGRAVSGEPPSAEAPILIRAVVFDLDGLMFDTEAPVLSRCFAGTGGSRQGVHAGDHEAVHRPARCRGRAVLEDAGRSRRAGRGLAGRRRDGSTP